MLVIQVFHFENGSIVAKRRCSFDWLEDGLPVELEREIIEEIAIALAGEEHVRRRIDTLVEDEVEVCV